MLINARMDITPQGENSPQVSGLPGPTDWATRLGGVPHPSCERDQEKKRDCIERLVTPPRRGTPPSRGPHLHVNRP